MRYCRLLDRVTVETGQTLRLGEVLRSPGMNLQDICIPCPDEPGVWKLHALDAVTLLRQAYPQEEFAMLGAEVCYIHRIPARHADPFRPLRTIAAFALLLIGSALGLAWFHSDVDMPRAMELVYTLLTGQAVTDVRLITWPYILGVALGVAVFYDVVPTKKAVTPLEIKLSEYQSDMEKAEGKDLPDA